MKFLREHAQAVGAAEDRPEYWYGVIEPFGGNLWDCLFYYEHAARKCAEQLGGGTVVIVTTRVLLDEEEDGHLPLPVRTKAMELKEAEQAVEESRKVFEDALKRDQS